MCSMSTAKTGPWLPLHPGPGGGGCAFCKSILLHKPGTPLPSNSSVMPVTRVMLTPR